MVKLDPLDFDFFVSKYSKCLLTNHHSLIPSPSPTGRRELIGSQAKFDCGETGSLPLWERARVREKC